MLRNLIILCGTMVPLCAIAKNDDAKPHFLVKHVQLLQELKEKFEQKQEPKPFFTRVIKSPSESHLHIMKDSWDIADAKNRHDKFIKEIIAKEKEFAATHYVFYHGQKGQHYILQDVLKKLYQFVAIHAPLKSFEFLRGWHSAQDHLDANKYIDAYEKDRAPGWGMFGGIEWNDHESALRKDMMCVNLALLGNSTGGGESSWHFFVTDSNINYTDINGLLDDIFNHFGFNKKFVPELLELLAGISPHFNSGLLQQVFIPRHKVDQCVYLSHPFGTPYRKPILADYFDANKKRHVGISAILDHYTSKPEKIDGLDRLQARVLFSSDVMLNPDSGVKIFRYTLGKVPNQALYEKKLDILMQIIFDDWMQSHSYKSVLKKNKLAQSPLGILLRLLSK